MKNIDRQQTERQTNRLKDEIKCKDKDGQQGNLSI